MERKCPLKHPWAWTLFAVLVVAFAVCAGRCAKRMRRERFDRFEESVPA